MQTESISERLREVAYKCEQKELYETAKQLFALANELDQAAHDIAEAYEFGPRFIYDIPKIVVRIGSTKCNHP